jgi:HEAT repeat protein
MSYSLCLLLICLPAAEPDKTEKPDVERLLSELKQDDAIKQDKAARALASAGAEAVPGLTEAVQSKKEGVVGRAARALGQIGAPAKKAVPALIERLKTNKGKSRDDAEVIEALMKIAPRSTEALSAFRVIVREPPANPSRVHAVVALGKMGPKAKEAVPDLIKVVGEAPRKDGFLRFHAATSLGQMGAEAKEAVPALVKLLGDKKAGPGRRTVVVALGQMGPAAKDAVDALKEARDEPALREAADKALAKIRGER